MRIEIISQHVCEECRTRRCKFLNTSCVKEDFFRLPSETSVCPTSAIDENGPSESQLKSGFIAAKDCVECGLCAKFCPYGNLKVEKCSGDADKFSFLTELQLKAVTSLYLSLLFGFAANTNRNHSLPFDCYVSTGSGNEAFVELDFGDDSLECLRRILGDMVVYSRTRPIRNGIVILSSLPRAGSRDIYTVMQKMRSFPTTKDIRIYVTTFSILRSLCMAGIKSVSDFGTLLFDYAKEAVDDYANRIDRIVNHVNP